MKKIIILLCFFGSVKAMEKAFVASKTLAEHQMAQQAGNPSGLALASHLRLSLNFALSNKHVIQTAIAKQNIPGGLSAQDPKYHHYVSMQMQGDIKSLYKELDKAQSKINKNRWFPMSAEKKQIVTLNYILSQSSMKQLKIIQSGSLGQAQQAYIALQQQFKAEALERSFNSQDTTVTEFQLQAARDLFTQRTDYNFNAYAAVQNYEPSLTGESQIESSSCSSTATSLVTEANTIIQLDSKPEVMLDMNSTSITDIEKFNTIVTADPKIDFPAYLMQINTFLYHCQEKIVTGALDITYFAKEFAQGTAEHIMHTAAHPVEFAYEFVEGNLHLMQQVADFYLKVYSLPEDFFLAERHENQMSAQVTQFMQEITEQFNQFQNAIAQMSRKDWAKLSSKFFADYIIFKGVATGINFAKELPQRIKTSPIFAHINQELELFAQRPQMVTPEGISVASLVDDSSAVLAKEANLIVNNTKREVILPKVKTYEQARNKALEIIGEVDVHTGEPHLGRLGTEKGKILGRRWHNRKVIMRLDYDPTKGPHVNVTDYRLGKGLNGKSICIPFEGSENTYQTLVKGLNSIETLKHAKVLFLSKRNFVEAEMIDMILQQLLK